MYIEVPVSPSRSTTSPFFTERARSMSASRSNTGVPANPPKNGVFVRNCLTAVSTGMRRILRLRANHTVQHPGWPTGGGFGSEDALLLVLLSGSARACLTARGPSPSLRMRWIEVGGNGMKLPTADRGATRRVVHWRLPASDRRQRADQFAVALSRGSRGA